MYFLTLCFSVLTSFFLIQKPPITISNSTEEIEHEIGKFDKGDSLALPYFNILIQKTKNERNYEELFEAYKNIHFYLPVSQWNLYADSAIWASVQTDNKLIISKAYLFKGGVNNYNREYEKALSNFIIAESYIQESDNEYLRNRINYSIGQLKNYLRIYDEAYLLVNSANKYFSKLKTKADTTFYLRTLIALEDMNTQLGNYDLSTGMYHKGLQLNIHSGNSKVIGLLEMYEGTNQYEQGNLEDAIYHFKKALPTAINDRRNSDLIYISFSLGLSNYDLGNKEKAIEYILYGDSLAVGENYVRPRFRRVYERLIEYYKSTGEKDKQLDAVNRLLDVDRKLSNQFKNISLKLKKEYDTKILLREKERLEKSSLAASENSLYLIIGLVSISLMLIVISVKNYRDKNNYQVLYQALVKKREDSKLNNPIKPDAPIENEIIKKEINISDEIIKKVVEKLSSLEKEDYFLESNITMSKLAKKVKTNTTYLSHIIKNKKQKTFTQYINEIRINALLQLFEQDSRLKNFTIISLAKEVGYNNVKTFKSAFKQVTGIPLSYFLERIDKEENT